MWSLIIIKDKEDKAFGDCDKTCRGRANRGHSFSGLWVGFPISTANQARDCRREKNYVLLCQWLSLVDWDGKTSLFGSRERFHVCASLFVLSQHRGRHTHTQRRDFFLNRKSGVLKKREGCFYGCSSGIQKDLIQLRVCLPWSGWIHNINPIKFCLFFLLERNLLSREKVTFKKKIIS